MKTEKVVLSFIAVLIGVLVAAIAFYLYQSTRVIKPTATKGASTSSSPTTPPTIENPLTISSPEDELVTEKRTIQISGKTDPQATVIISTEDEDKVVTPTSSGTFSTTATLSDGENEIVFTAFMPDGQESVVKRTVSFSTESF